MSDHDDHQTDLSERMTEPEPTYAQGMEIDHFAEAAYELLSERAGSWNAIDVSVATDDWYVDGELHFSTAPDMGFSLHTRTGELHCCELLGDDGERWLEGIQGELPIFGQDLESTTKALADAVIAGRRAIQGKDPRDRSAEGDVVLRAEPRLDLDIGAD